MKTAQQIRVLVVPPGKAPVVRSLSRSPDRLVARLNGLVEGPGQAHLLFEDPDGRGLDAWLNASHTAGCLPKNRELRAWPEKEEGSEGHFFAHGTFVLIGHDAAGKPCDLTDDDLELYSVLWDCHPTESELREIEDSLRGGAPPRL